MTTQAFAPWVEPLAEEMLQGAAELLSFARSKPGDFWNRPSALPGWSCKDILAHLAGDTDKVSSRAMRAAVDNVAFENPPDFADGGDGPNARDVEARRGQSVEELVAEIEADRREWRVLLSQLTESDDDARWPGFPLSLGQYLRLCARHDLEHLEHLRAEPEAAR
jgi:uncharacterized protein (TIGR03083 family)